MQGIIQENDRFRDEMDRLEKELSRLRKLHAAFGRKDIGNRSEMGWEDETVVDNTEKDKACSKTTSVIYTSCYTDILQAPTEIALVVIDGDYFRVPGNCICGLI